ncbi:MAG TPA: PAS domain S-box protein, partial [Myxococcota bacterium]|nr:PAS domain S-box protein [Myxococcota bacterium]
MTDATAPPAAESPTAARIVAGSASIAVVAGLMVLIGWRLEVGLLKSLLPSFAPMPPDSALCFVLIGGALALSIVRARATRYGSGLLAALVLAAGVVAGFEALLGVQTGATQLFSTWARNPSASDVLRMAPESAFAFALLGGSLLATRAALAQVLASIPLSLAAIALVGFLYGAPPLGLRTYAPMSLFSSLAFLAAASGALFRKPETGFAAALLDPSVAGSELRRLIAPAVGIPLIAAAMVLAIARGQLMSPATEATLLAVSTMAALIGVAFRSYLSLRRAERERLGALSALLASESRFRRTFDNAPIGMAQLSAEGRWLSVNPRLEEMLGYAKEDLLRMTYADVTPLEDL